LQGSPIWERGNVKAFVLYGLGTLKNGRRASLYQLALSQILPDMLPSLKGQPECYDPNFGSVAIALLSSLGYKVRHGGLSQGFLSF
jgi:hypothetical protein